jgi:hypothetical protein
MGGQWEEVQKKYPGTIALFRSVRGLQDLQEDGKEPLSSAQAKAVVPILKSLPSKEKLTQDEAKKVADQINGYLTPTQQEIIGARREARMSQWRRGGGGGMGGGGMGPGGGAGGQGKMGGPGGMGGGMGGPGGGAGRSGGGMGRMFTDLKPDENPFRQERGKEMLEGVIGTLEGKGK